MVMEEPDQPRGLTSPTDIKTEPTEVECVEEFSCYFVCDYVTYSESFFVNHVETEHLGRPLTSFKPNLKTYIRSKSAPTTGTVSCVKIERLKNLMKEALHSKISTVYLPAIVSKSEEVSEIRGSVEKSTEEASNIEIRTVHVPAIVPKSEEANEIRGSAEKLTQEASNIEIRTVHVPAIVPKSKEASEIRGSVEKLTEEAPNIEISTVHVPAIVPKSEEVSEIRGSVEKSMEEAPNIEISTVHVPAIVSKSNNKIRGSVEKSAKEAANIEISTVHVPIIVPKSEEVNSEIPDSVEKSVDEATGGEISTVHVPIMAPKCEEVITEIRGSAEKSTGEVANSEIGAVSASVVDVSKSEEIDLGVAEFRGEYQCRKCSFRGEDYKDFTRHFELHIVPSPLSNYEREMSFLLETCKNLVKDTKWRTKKYACGYCSHVAETEKYWKDHMAICHIFPNRTWTEADYVKKPCIFNCDLCRFNTKQTWRLIEHEYIFHARYVKKDVRIVETSSMDPPVASTDPQVATCPTDLQVPVFPVMYLLPSRSKLKTFRRYKCDNCSFRCNTWQRMKRHKYNKHTPIEKMIWYLCEHCAYRTVFRHTLSKHILDKHTPDEDLNFHRCSKCSYKTIRRGNLKTHILTKHTPDDAINWFKCADCPYKAKLKVCLLEHVRKHKNLHLKCEHCSYKTMRTDLLRKHTAKVHNTTNSKRRLIK